MSILLSSFRYPGGSAVFCFIKTNKFISALFKRADLFQRIPEGLKIPGLRDSLVKILQDFNLQVNSLIAVPLRSAIDWASWKNMRSKQGSPKGFTKGSVSNNFVHMPKGVFTWENSHRREFHTGMTFDFESRLRDDWIISYLVIWRCTSCW